MKVEHEMKLDKTEMCTIREICGFTLNKRKNSAELREVDRVCILSS